MKEYTSLSVEKETSRKIEAANQTFEPRMSRAGFAEELLDFYLKYHCPECGQETAKKVQHKC